MPTFLIALASALLLAALVTETVQRFWPDNYVALLVITFSALLLNGLFNARLKQSGADTAPAKGRGKAKADAQQRAPKNKGAQRARRDNKSGRDTRVREKSEDNAPRGPEETGTVKWFNRSKGYGFIIRDNGDEVFVHQRSIAPTGDQRQRPALRDGQKVSFVVAHLEKGAQAEQVKPLD